MSRPVRCALLLLFAVTLPACREDATGPGQLSILDCAQGSSYRIGRMVNGALGSGDCLDPGGVAYADYYQFTVGTAGPVSISVATTASSPPMVIALFSEDLDVIDFDEFMPGGMGVMGGQLAPGTYIIIVGASEPGASGGYALSSSNTLPPTFACDRFAAITIGSTIAGTIAASDCLDPVNVASADYFDFTLATASPVTFVVTPDDAGQMVAALATDGGVFLRVVAATREVPAVLGGMLPAGRYVLVVAGSEAGQTGGYTVVSRAELPPIAGVPPFLGCTDPQPYSIGTTASGTLARTDCIDSFDTPVDRYDFTIAAAQTITFDLVSISFDPFLALFNATGGLIAFDDDSGEGVNARLTVTLPAGSYAIGATGYYATSLGDYTLSSQAVAAGSGAAAVEGTGAVTWGSARMITADPRNRRPVGALEW